MTETQGAARPQDSEPPARIGLALVLFAAALVVLVNLAGLSGWNAKLLQGGLMDSDSYLRLLRILELRQGSPWYHDVTERLGAPDGLVIQWSRPLDVAILLPALALERLVGLSPREALLAVGIGISPVFHLAAALAAAWAAQAMWPGRAPWYAVLLMVGTSSAATYSALGRPDHHGLIILLLTLGLGGVVRALRPDGGARPAHGAGIAFGCALWVGPEALIVAMPALAGIGLAAVLAADGRAPALQGRRVCLGMAATLAVAMLVEHRPEEWLRAEYDRVSIAQLGLVLFALAVFAVTARAGGLPRPRRLLVAGGAAALAAAGLLLLLPGTIRGPLANADEAYLRLLHPMIQENQPLPPFGPGNPWDFALHVGGAAFVGLLALGFAMPGWIKDGRWQAGLVLAASLLVALAATVGARRFGMDLAPPAAIAGAGLVGLLLHAAWPKQVALRALLAMVLFFGALAVPLLEAFTADRSAAQGTARDGAAPAACDWIAMGRWLDAERPLFDGRGPAPILMASDVFEGPGLAWRTPYRLVTSPHHRAGRAIEDTASVFSASDADAAHAVLLRRGVGLLLDCVAKAPLFPGDFADRLRGGTPPDWLQPVGLPASLAGFRLFVVRP